ncbi:MAG: homoserine dehydrogenase [Rhodothermales bacterium]|nr:homoserine dehydrogenase [Rhodothermales bacterium]
MRQIPVIILGLGGVGRELLGQLAASRHVHEQRARAHFNTICAADSSHFLSSPGGLSDSVMLDLINDKKSGTGFGKAHTGPTNIVEEFIDASKFGIVVDVTATDETRDALVSALELGWGVVLANKKPLAGPLDLALPLFASDRVRYESTVGAGQPVIATLQYLLDTNDSIRRVEGQLSGSLGYICSQLDAQIKFSDALRTARELGFTEPDPREDLAGKDVMRKAIILGRTAGLQMSEDDVSVECLYSEDLGALDVDHFMSAAEGMDDVFARRVAEAAAGGYVLRYVASIEGGKAEIGLKPVPKNSALANLKYVSFQTDRYDDEPLLIGGKGAGVGITAAGVVGDMIRLCKENLN